MCRIRRFVFRTITAFAVALAVAGALLGLRSFWVYDRSEFRTTTAMPSQSGAYRVHCITLESLRGRCELSWETKQDATDPAELRWGGRLVPGFEWYLAHAPSDVMCHVVRKSPLIGSSREGNGDFRTPVVALSWQRDRLYIAHWLCIAPAIIFLTGSVSNSWLRSCRCRRRCPAGLCTRCSYDLTGNVSSVCPECGLRIVTEAP